MNKKKTVKNIKTHNKFDWGGDFKQSFEDSFSGANMGKAIPGAAGAIGGIAGGLISNGFSTTGGQVLSGIGDAAMMVNPLIGGAIKLASGLVNRGFGTKWNNEELAKAEAGIDSLKAFSSGATNYDALMGDINKINQFNTNIKASDLGEDGWFVNRTQKKANELNTSMSNAYNFALRNTNNVANNIASSTLANLERNYAAFGGPLFAYGGQTHGADFSNGLMFINKGGTHESNPYEGVPISMDQEGNPNLVEEGEVIWNDYVFSDRLKVPKAVRTKYKLRGHKDMTFAKAVENISKESDERPNDPISQRGLNIGLMKLAMEQELIKQKNNIKPNTNKFLGGGPLGIYPDEEEEVYIIPTGSKTAGINPEVKDDVYTAPSPNPKVKKENTEQVPYEKLPTWMRFAPAVGYGALALTDAFGITNKPDYTNAEAIINAANNVSNSTIKFNPIGDYLTYNPFDTEYHANQLRAVSGATRRHIMNTSGGNRAAAMAGILAADNNTMNQMGDLYRKAAEYNLEQRQKVADFNRATNTTNSEGIFRADAANQSARQAGLQALMSGYTMKEQAKLMSDQAKAANISGLFTSLGNIGYENANRNMMNWGMATGTWAPSQWKYDPLTGKPVNQNE